MGTKYASQSATGYNSSPPSDDGSTAASNKITWATIKTKLPDPLKSFIESVNTALVTALDVSITERSANYTTTTADHLRPIFCTNSITISLGTATSMAIGYQVTVVNVGSGTVTVGLITGTDTLNGSAGGSVLMPPQQCLTFETNASANGYNIVSGSVAATQADQEQGTNRARIVTPGTQHFHLGHPKGWVIADTTGAVPAGYNVTSVTDAGTGWSLVNWATAFASTSYCPLGSFAHATELLSHKILDISAASTQILVYSVGDTPVATDPSYFMVLAMGDQA